MFPCWLLADGVARREPEQRATRWVGTYRTVSVSSPELVSSNLDQEIKLPPIGSHANFLFSSLLLVEIADTKGK
jgi:hypothetical protein